MFEPQTQTCPPLAPFNELLRIGNRHRDRQSVDKVGNNRNLAVIWP
jgi:hypothetical protein